MTRTLMISFAKSWKPSNRAACDALLFEGEVLTLLGEISIKHGQMRQWSSTVCELSCLRDKLT
jgi:hypothetical protein